MQIPEGGGPRGAAEEAPLFSRTALHGRTAVVTGGSRGIGAATAVALASAGARVAILYRANTAAAETTLSRVRGAGSVESLAVRADVTSELEIETAFRTTAERLGDVDILVNSAGIHRGGRVTRIRPSDFRAVVETNLVGAFLCSRPAIASMRHAGWGRIVNIGSVVGLRGFPGDAAYASSKAGLLGLTRALAVELATAGITVNLIAPGFVDTDMTAGLSAESLRAIKGSIPADRQASAMEVAELVVAVTCAPYMTGATVPLDGGYLIR